MTVEISAPLSKLISHQQIKITLFFIPPFSAAFPAAIEVAGAMLFYLPPFSPDFNPIENRLLQAKSSAVRMRKFFAASTTAQETFAYLRQSMADRPAGLHPIIRDYRV
jgi:hypothetical protein